MMVQLHWFREQRPIVRSMIGLVVIATVLCLFLVPSAFCTHWDLRFSTY